MPAEAALSPGACGAHVAAPPRGDSGGAIRRLGATHRLWYHGRWAPAGDQRCAREGTLPTSSQQLLVSGAPIPRRPPPVVARPKGPGERSPHTA